MTEALDIDGLAALGALGLLTEHESAQIERVAAGEVIAYREALLQIAESLDPVAPPAFVKANILKAVRSRTVRANEGRWFEIAEGVRMKKLSSDRSRNTVTVLMEMAPGSEVPPHDHKWSEDSFCIRGSCTIGAETFFPGDFHHVEGGAHHDTITSEEGCLILLVMDYEDYRAA
jgi:anti-sigma factor ChrR (cupin superfamily)